MNNPLWLDRSKYPFQSHYLELAMGRMHYIDEGDGEAIVMCHGNPTWSFLYRHLAKGLSPDYRCLAMDYIGYGLSDKPEWWSYMPQAQAQNVEALIEYLGLRDITLVIQDWGGPIGLSYALKHPENVKRLVIMNTWMWSVKGIRDYELFSGFMGGPIGRFLVMNFNFFARYVMRLVTADKRTLDPATHQHYIQPFARRQHRRPTWIMPGQIIGSSDWLASLWAERAKIQHIPALFLWGMKDTSFKERELRRFQGMFDNYETIRFEDVGHFVQEEKKSDLVPLIRTFLARQLTLSLVRTQV